MTTIRRVKILAALLIATVAGSGDRATAAEAPRPVGVVSHIKVLSDKVADVSSLEAWKRSFIADGMTDQEKALAIWKSNVAFVYQDAPPIEFLHEGCVHDAIKDFNVYGYGMCCCASARVEQLARYVGLPARGWGINGHSVPEVFWAGGWHLLDASLATYFTRPDGQIASVAEVGQAVQGWLGEHPAYKGNDKKLRQFQQAGGWTGWKQGPALLGDCKFYDAGGWWPAKTHGWYATMQEFDGSHKTPFPFEYGYSQGYEVNIQLRPGERLVRNWFNKGLHVNGILHDGGSPGCLAAKVGEGAMAFLRDYGDLTAGRVGSGRLEYDVPTDVYAAEAKRAGAFDIDMPSSYVYLTGQIEADATVGDGGQIRFLLSDTNGKDWRDVATVARSGRQTIDIQKFVLRRYDYRLRVKIEGKGTGLESLKITHDVQCSQRALPTLGRGANTITFSACATEGTVTIEGSTEEGKQGKQVTPMDFHPTLMGLAQQNFHVKGGTGSATFAIDTPGEMTRLRMGGHYRVRDPGDRWDMQVSYDNGRTFKTVDTQTGPYQGICKYITVGDVPAGTKTAQVRWLGTQRNTTCLFLVRIDADYRQPHDGFRPVKVTYVWDEDGRERKDVHVARSPEETYKITCASKPVMKSIILELAE
jgi:hypothetical protein